MPAHAQPTRPPDRRDPDELRGRELAALATSSRPRSSSASARRTSAGSREPGGTSSSICPRASSGGPATSRCSGARSCSRPTSSRGSSTPRKSRPPLPPGIRRGRRKGGAKCGAVTSRRERSGIDRRRRTRAEKTGLQPTEVGWSPTVHSFKWPRWDLNPHALRRSILSRVRLPFRHLAGAFQHRRRRRAEQGGSAA